MRSAALRDELDATRAASACFGLQSKQQLATWPKHNHHTLTMLFYEYTHGALLNPKRSTLLQKRPS